VLAPIHYHVIMKLGDGVRVGVRHALSVCVKEAIGGRGQHFSDRGQDLKLTHTLAPKIEAAINTNSIIEQINCGDAWSVVLLVLLVNLEGFRKDKTARGGLTWGRRARLTRRGERRRGGVVGEHSMILSNVLGGTGVVEQRIATARATGNLAPSRSKTVGVQLADFKLRRSLNLPKKGLIQVKLRGESGGGCRGLNGLGTTVSGECGEMVSTSRRNVLWRGRDYDRRFRRGTSNARRRGLTTRSDSHGDAINKGVLAEIDLILNLRSDGDATPIGERGLS